MKTLISAIAFVSFTAGVSAQEPVWDANIVMLESQKLAEGIYAVVPTDAATLAPQGVPLATTSGFIIGEHSVLAIDSMLNERLNAQLLGLIAAETDLPLRYLVNTSYHGDHSYGNAYLPENVIIIQHQAAADYIDTHFVEDMAFMVNNFGAGRGIEEITPTDADLRIGQGGSLNIDLGNITVHIEDYGYAQTGGDLFVTVPSANIMWTGNPIVAEAPALPWLLDGHLIETRDTLQRVYDTTDAQTRVVPGHGPVTNHAAIRYSIDYLTTIEEQVGTAVADGLDLEQTVARVDVPNFHGYALFDWVHPGLNIPAAFNDLQ